MERSAIEVASFCVLVQARDRDHGELFDEAAARAITRRAEDHLLNDVLVVVIAHSVAASGAGHPMRYHRHGRSGFAEREIRRRINVARWRCVPDPVSTIRL